LIADAFHMLSDLFSLGVGIAALKLVERDHTETMTYGWVRAEILGGLINGVLLLSLSFTIIIQAIQRFFEPIEIKRPVLILIVASVGLLFNIVGLLIFSGHGHHGHSHSHGHGHEHKPKQLERESSKSVILTEVKAKVQKEESTTMYSVFLHILGDALGSIAVIFSALFIWLTHFKWRFYADPIVSIALSLILVRSALRLVRTTSLVLLQRVPTNIKFDVIKEEIGKVDGVLSIHELHIWQLDDKRNICTAHVVCDVNKAFMDIGVQIKEVLHQHGVHSATIQPEFVGAAEEYSQCSLVCKESSCRKRRCCSYEMLN